jgi:hypothetical protein
MYRDYRGFLVTQVGMRIYSLLCYMLDNALLGRLGDMSGCQFRLSKTMKKYSLVPPGKSVMP